MSTPVIPQQAKQGDDTTELEAQSRREETDARLGKLVRINAFSATKPSDFAMLKEDRPKRVLLVAPTSTHEVGMTKWLSVNLGIERLAATLRQHGHYAETYDVNLYKCMQTGQGQDSLTLEEKIRADDWDVIGFSVYEATMINDFVHMNLAKKISPASLIVAGGHAAQFNYQTILDKTPARVVILGEGERPMVQLLGGAPLEEVQGIVIRNSSAPMDGPEFREATEIIDYESMPYEIYWDYYINLHREAGIEITPEISQTIHTARIYTRNHCPMNCKFCSSTNWLTFAAGSRVGIADLSGTQLLALVQRIMKAHPRVETIYFTDDEFCLIRDKLLEFLHAVIEIKLEMTFIAFTRIDDLDEEVISLMAQAGFRTLNIGIESFQPEILREYHKGVKAEQIERALELLNKHGIRPSCSFILTSPEAKLEWVENVARRIQLEVANGTLSAGVNIAVEPQRGSGFWEEYNEFEIERTQIPGTQMYLKHYHFVKATDPETREFQYRFLHRWGTYIEEVLSQSKGHWNSQVQSSLKLELVLEVIEEIKSERGRDDRYRYTQMSEAERGRLWTILSRYSYGASL